MMPLWHRVMWIGFSLVLVIGPGRYALGQEFSMVVDSLHPVGIEPQAPMRVAPNGDLYALSKRGIIHVTEPEQARQVFTASSPDYLVQVPGASQSDVVLNGIRDYAVDSVGNVYVAGENSHNVVRISPDGQVQELINASGDGLGNTLQRPVALALDDAGNVYVVASGSLNVFKISVSGQVSLLLGSDGVGKHALSFPTRLALGVDGSVYVASHYAVFRILPSGQASVYLDHGFDRAPHRYGSHFFVHFSVDDFGNLYFVYADEANTLYRYSQTLGLETLVDYRGDGTGEVLCSKIGPMEHDPIVCTGYGNYLRTIAGIHIDAAQNVLVVGRNSRNVFKVTPLGLVSEVLDFSALENFTVEVVRDVGFDAWGHFYFLHAKNNGSGTAILSFSPFPVEEANDFRLHAPHAGVSHSASGVSLLSDAYTRTALAWQTVPAQALSRLDTRAPVFVSLPWQQGSRVESAGSIRTTVAQEGHTYVETLQVSNPEAGPGPVLNSIEYSVDGTQAYVLSGLQMPLKLYNSLAPHNVMSWLYLGNDVIIGSPQADVLYAYEGNDILYGGAGDDLLDGSSGANIFYGGDGVDMAVYERRLSDYMLSRNPLNGFVSVQSKAGMGAPDVDQLAPDVERLRFRDAEISTEELSYWGELESVQSAPQENEEGDNFRVYRFFNTRDKAFFYTIDPNERTAVVRNSATPNSQEADWTYVYQGAGFQAAHTYSGSVPLYRFYNTETGHHFFTISEEERAQIHRNVRDAGWPFVEEGVAFEVYPEDPTPGVVGKEKPVYRFYSWTLDRHIFTASEQESVMLKVSPQWQYEGVAFYAEGLE